MKTFSKMRISRWTAVILVAFVLVPILPAAEAHAFSRGLAEKVRRMRAGAYAERFNLAAEAFRSGDFDTCVREALLALDHASNADQAVAAHQLLAAAYLKLSNPASAAHHQAWLAEHASNKS